LSVKPARKIFFPHQAQPIDRLFAYGPLDQTRLSYFYWLH
jgi:hypothetical protein